MPRGIGPNINTAWRAADITTERAKFWKFQAAQNEPKTGELLLYGVISSESWSGDEVTPKQFKTDLDNLGDISNLRVYINSGGGDVFAGQAIHSMLKRHPARVVVYVDGLAASIASVIAMAGDRVIMPRNSMMMVHRPWTVAMGNAEDFRKAAGDLDRVCESLLAAYQAKTKMPRDELIALLDAETWMTAAEAVEYGFADELDATKEFAASYSDERLTINGRSFDLSQYRHRPALPDNTRATSGTNRAAAWSLIERQLNPRAKIRVSEVAALLADSPGNRTEDLAGQMIRTAAGGKGLGAVRTVSGEYLIVKHHGRR